MEEGGGGGGGAKYGSVDSRVPGLFTPEVV